MKRSRTSSLSGSNRHRKCTPSFVTASKPLNAWRFALRAARTRCSRMLDPVVICDRDDLNTDFKAGLDDRRIVFVFRSEGGRLLVCLKIGERIDLQGAAVEPRTVRKIRVRPACDPRAAASGLGTSAVISCSPSAVDRVEPHSCSDFVLAVRRRIAPPRPVRPRPVIPSSALASCSSTP